MLCSSSKLFAGEGVRKRQGWQKLQCCSQVGVPRDVAVTRHCLHASIIGMHVHSSCTCTPLAPKHTPTHLQQCFRSIQTLAYVLCTRSQMLLPNRAADPPTVPLGSNGAGTLSKANTCGQMCMVHDCNDQTARPAKRQHLAAAR